MQNYYKELYEKQVDNRFKRSRQIGEVLGQLRLLEVDLEFDNIKTLKKRIERIYDELNKIEL
jgi:hypothetical protein